MNTAGHHVKTILRQRKDNYMDQFVIITVKGGVAYISNVPKNMVAVIVDYDNDEEKPNVNFQLGPYSSVSPETESAINEWRATWKI